ncbi:MAG: hypothetical protein ACRDMX_14095, partial [Solirubrobacteraceae bacterium]
RRAADAAAAARATRPSDEELGYVSTEDSLTKILNDAADQLSDRFSQTSRSSAAHHLGDLIDRLTGESPKH